MSKAICFSVAVLFVAASLSEDVSGVALAAVERPSDCQSSDDKFINCFMCGRLANDKRVYSGCCESLKFINDYCKLMLA